MSCEYEKLVRNRERMRKRFIDCRVIPGYFSKPVGKALLSFITGNRQGWYTE